MKVYTIHEQGRFEDQYDLTPDPPNDAPQGTGVKGRWALCSMWFMGTWQYKRPSGNVGGRKIKVLKDRFLVEWVWEVSPEEHESIRLTNNAVSNLLSALRETFGSGKWFYTEAGLTEVPRQLTEPDTNPDRYVWESLGKWAKAIRDLRFPPIASR